MKQNKMAFCFYKKIIKVLIPCLLISFLFAGNNFASLVIWPSEMNLYNEDIDFESLIPHDATASNSKKGFLFTGDANEIFILGAGHIAINITLSGKGHVFYQLLETIKNRGVKITMIVTNDKPHVGASPLNAPPDFQKPYFYMIDFYGHSGDWQKFNFDRIIDEYGKIVDNWVIGNEINSQVYNFYGPSYIEEYTNVYCKSFLYAYNKIKNVNKDANVYIPFDQGWDRPHLRKNDKRYDKERAKYEYNITEQLLYINKYLGKDIDWGLSLHPYPDPVKSAKFWDDNYSGYNNESKNEKEHAMLLTLKNFEVALAFINSKEFLYKGKEARKVIISEFGLTSHDGEEIQAAGLYYLWQKICKYEQIVALLYNAQTDLPDGYNFGLSTVDNKKRLIWAVFKDMDNPSANGWCKDLLDRILLDNGYINEDTILIKAPK